MTKRLKRSNLQVSETLVNFIEKEALPNTDISPENFWDKFQLILDKFVPQNNKLLQVRTEMKNKIDNFYKQNIGKKIDHDEYVNFLKKINYIVPVGDDFKITTQNVITLDGVRAKNEFGWWLIRASNTEEAIVIRYEGRSQKDKDSLLIEVKKRLKNEGLAWE